MADRSDETGDERRGKRRAKVAAGAKKLNESPALLTAAKIVRQLLPGDSKFGDPLSTAGKKQAEIAGKRLSELTAERPGVLREAGLSALQVWQALSEAQGRGRGAEEGAIVFTDLVAFSEWALEVGDDAALRLLRCLDDVLEPTVREHGGEVVKRLGDGMMAAFDDPQAALEALLAIFGDLDTVE